MTRTGRTLMIIFIGLTGMYLTARVLSDEVQKSELYRQGESAAAAGRWAEAFTKFQRLSEIDSAYDDVSQRLAEVVQQVALTGPGQADPDTEIELLRWLVRSGDATQLAQILDRSTVPIAAGAFVMGSNTGRSDERPERSVYLSVFEIDRFEVTNAQYRRFLQATNRPAPPYWSGFDYPTSQADYPVVGVNWDDANAYCSWIGKRLPTEAEWEKACRGIDGSLYPWGNTWNQGRGNVEVSEQSPWPMDWDQTWTFLSSTPSSSNERQLKPIGSYPDGASPYGILDMVGNASEWVEDWYNWSDYKDLPSQNPRSLGPPWNHCLRGTPWFDPYGSTSWTQEMSRCSARNSSHETQDPRVGFRCALSVTP